MPTPHALGLNSVKACGKRAGPFSPVLTMLLGLCLLTPARAGHYSGPQYSGGSLTISGSPQPYTLQSDGTWGAHASADFSADGQITAVFTWVPDGPGDDPPKSVVVAETGGATGGGDAIGRSPQVDCAADDGLGDTPQTESSYQDYGSYADQHKNTSSGGTRYQILSPAADGSVTLHCTPTASLTRSGDPLFGGSGGGGVSYKASASPLEVVLSGGIGPSKAKRYLIGQHCTATLSPGGLTPSNFHWAASGGTPFKNWTANDNNAVFTALGSETGSSLDCYFAKQASSGGAAVSCTVDLAVPPGAKPTAGFPGISVSQTLSVEVPTFVPSIHFGTVKAEPTPTDPTFVALEQFTRSTPDPEARGMEWYGTTVTTPSDYTSAGIGQWNWTQLITSHREVKENGAWNSVAMSQPSPNTPIKILNRKCLDGSYPYGGFWYVSDGTQNGNYDSPYQMLGTNLSDTDWRLGDDFASYIMYLPPGQDSVSVPLTMYAWSWTATAARNTTTTGSPWGVSNTGQNCTPAGDYPAHPEWSPPTFVNGNMTFVP